MRLVTSIIFLIVSNFAWGRSECYMYNTLNHNKTPLILALAPVNRNHTTTGSKSWVQSREFASVPLGGFVQILKTTDYHQIFSITEISYFDDLGERKYWVSKNNIDHSDIPFVSLKIQFDSHSPLGRELTCKTDLLN